MSDILLIERSEAFKAAICAALGEASVSCSIPEGGNASVILIGPGAEQQNKVFELITQMQRKFPNASVIVISVLSQPQVMARAQSLGAFDYILMHSLHDRLPAAVERALGRKLDVGRQVLAPFRREFVGESREALGVLEALQRYSKADCDVLLLGETGTGKDVCAQLIHRESSRGSKPFVALNCSAIPSQLLESQLFGHKKGAYTGATDNLVGLFEKTQAGVLFLDEIGELKPSFQVKMLRVLESRAFTPVGSSTEQQFRGRILYATNCDLRALTDKNQFRRDLYHRISANQIRLPPLRERQQDILPLAKHFIELNKRLQPSPTISDEARVLLFSCPFDGNVRQLKSVIDHALLQLDDDEHEVLPRHLPLAEMFRAPGKAPKPRSSTPPGVATPIQDATSSGFPEAVNAAEPAAAAPLKKHQSPDDPEGAQTGQHPTPDEMIPSTWREGIKPLEQEFNRKKQEFARTYLPKLLMEAGYKKAKAARAAGINVDTFEKYWQDAGLGPI